MVRGWFRPSQRPGGLPESTRNARRGEYKSWEPLGRLLLPKMHQQVDEVLKARKEAARDSPQPQSTTQTQSDIGEQGQLTAQPNQSSTTANDDNTAEREVEAQSQRYSSEESGRDADSVTGGRAGLDVHSRHLASRPASRRGNSRENNNGGTDEGDNSNHSVAAAHPESREQPNRQNTPPPGTNSRPDHAPFEQVQAAYYEEPLPIYTRYPEPTQRLRQTDALDSTRIFCANCEPQAQVSRSSLLSDYLCGTCWVDFILWRSN